MITYAMWNLQLGSRGYSLLNFFSSSFKVMYIVPCVIIIICQNVDLTFKLQIYDWRVTVHEHSPPTSKCVVGVGVGCIIYIVFNDM